MIYIMQKKSSSWNDLTEMFTFVILFKNGLGHIKKVILNKWEISQLFFSKELYCGHKDTRL